jgi:hypothetical protein
MAFNGDEIPNGMGLHAKAKSDHFTAGFVTGNGSEWYVFSTPLVPLPNVNIGAAYGCRMGFYQNFTFVRRWNRVFYSAETTYGISSLCPSKHGFWNFTHASPLFAFSAPTL